MRPEADEVADQARGPGSFGEELRRLRIDAGLTQEPLAERSGISVKAISALENGDRTAPARHRRDARWRSRPSGPRRTSIRPRALPPAPCVGIPPDPVAHLVGRGARADGPGARAAAWWARRGPRPGRRGQDAARRALPPQLARGVSGRDVLA